MAKVPDRIYIGAEDRVIYKKIDETADLFKKKNNKEQFLFAMAIGFSNNTRIPLKKKENWFLKKDLKPEDEAILNVVALKATGDTSVLPDKSEVYKIVEEYAHAGLKILLDNIESAEFGTYWKQLEKNINKLSKEMSLWEGNHER